MALWNLFGTGSIRVSRAWTETRARGAEQTGFHEIVLTPSPVLAQMFVPMEELEGCPRTETITRAVAVVDTSSTPMSCFVMFGSPAVGYWAFDVMDTSWNRLAPVDFDEIAQDGLYGVTTPPTRVFRARDIVPHLLKGPTTMLQATVTTVRKDGAVGVERVQVSRVAQEEHAPDDDMVKPLPTASLKSNPGKEAVVAMLAMLDEYLRAVETQPKTYTPETRVRLTGPPATEMSRENTSPKKRARAPSADGRHVRRRAEVIEETMVAEMQLVANSISHFEIQKAMENHWKANVETLKQAYEASTKDTEAKYDALQKKFDDLLSRFDDLLSRFEKFDAQTAFYETLKSAFLQKP